MRLIAESVEEVRQGMQTASRIAPVNFVSQTASMPFLFQQDQLNTAPSSAAAPVGASALHCQDLPRLFSTACTATFEAGDSEAILGLPASRFSSGGTQSGDLVPIVAATGGCDASGATAAVRVYPHDGSLTVRVSLDSPSYTLAEDAGTVNLKLVARPESNLPFVPTFYVSVSSQSGTAGSLGDYRDFSRTEEIDNVDFVMETGQQDARLDVPVTILDESKCVGDGTFSFAQEWSPGVSRDVILVDPESNDRAGNCDNPHPVTILDDDPQPMFQLSTNANHLNESAGDGNSIAVRIASDNCSSYDADRTFTTLLAGTAILGQDFTIALRDDAVQTPGCQTVLEAGEAWHEIHPTATQDTHNDPCEWIGESFVPGIPPFGTGPESRFLIRRKRGREVHHRGEAPVGAGDPFVPAAGGDIWQIPGYMADPSIREVVDSENNQVLREHDQGGFTRNFARAFFTPAIAVPTESRSAPGSRG